MATDVTLETFVKQLVAEMSARNMTTFLKEEQPWHELLFELKRSDLRGKPQFLSKLQFNWGGPFPKSRDLSRYLQFLHLTGCIGMMNPSFETTVLDPDLQQKWREEANSLPEETKSFLHSAADIAQKRFEPAESRTQSRVE